MEKYANKYGWSDIHPFEIVKHVSETRKVVKEMKAELDPNWKPEFVEGGFFGHCVNQHTQNWIIESDPDGDQITIRLHKDGRWYDRNGGRYKLADTPIRFYDYNF